LIENIYNSIIMEKHNRNTNKTYAKKIKYTCGKQFQNLLSILFKSACLKVNKKSSDSTIIKTIVIGKDATSVKFTLLKHLTAAR
jgi:hypothetical protein